MMNDKYDSQSRTYYEAQTYRPIVNGKTFRNPVQFIFSLTKDLGIYLKH